MFRKGTYIQKSERSVLQALWMKRTGNKDYGNIDEHMLVYR